MPGSSTWGACQDPLHGGSERLTASRSGKAIEKNCRRGEALDLSYIKCTPRTRLLLGKNEYISPLIPVLSTRPSGRWMRSYWVSCSGPGHRRANTKRPSGDQLRLGRQANWDLSKLFYEPTSPELMLRIARL